VTRVIIRDFSVQGTVLPAGTLLSECRVVKHHGGEGDEPYLVHFATAGRSYTCPLYAFQPRTQAIDTEPAAIEQAPAALAV